MTKPLPNMTDRAILRFQIGTFARIAATLGPGEDRTAFIRDAVERQLQHREAEISKPVQQPDAPSAKMATRRRGT